MLKEGNKISSLLPVSDSVFVFFFFFWTIEIELTRSLSKLFYFIVRGNFLKTSTRQNVSNICN